MLNKHLLLTFLGLTSEIELLNIALTEALKTSEDDNNMPYQSKTDENYLKFYQQKDSAKSLMESLISYNQRTDLSSKGTSENSLKQLYKANEFFNAGTLNLTKNRSNVSVEIPFQYQNHYGIQIKLSKSQLIFLFMDHSNNLNISSLKELIKKRALTFIKLAHELKNPIYTINTLTSSLKNYLSSPEKTFIKNNPQESEEEDDVLDEVEEKSKTLKCSSFSSNRDSNINDIMKSHLTYKSYNQNNINFIISLCDFLLILIEDINTFVKKDPLVMPENVGDSPNNGNIAITPVHLLTLLEFCFTIFDNRQKYETAKKGVKVKLEIDKNLPKKVMSNDTKLKQVVINLMSNAYKFTSYGDVILSAQLIEKENEKIEGTNEKQEKIEEENVELKEVTPEKVQKLLKPIIDEQKKIDKSNLSNKGSPEIKTVSIIERNDSPNQFEYNKNSKYYIRIGVKDSGSGLSSEEINNLFKPFGMLEKNQSLNTYGSGLGLNIVKETLKSIKSEILIKSEINKGSFFFFDIPFKQEEVIEYERQHKNNSNISNASYMSNNILSSNNSNFNITISKNNNNFSKFQ